MNFYYKAVEATAETIQQSSGETITYKTGGVELLKFLVIRKSEKFVWLDVEGMKKAKRVHLDGKTSFAFPTPEKAYKSLWYKKHYRAKFLKQELRHCELVALNCCNLSGIKFHETEGQGGDDLPY